MIGRAIKKINPDAEFTINANDINQITWYNGTTPISKSDIEAQYPAVEFDIAIEQLRFTRNRLLRQTDFYALGDVTMSDDMKTYRQQLRDITNGVNTEAKAKNKTFPTKPE